MNGKATSNELVWKGEYTPTHDADPDYLTYLYKGNGWFEGADNQYPTNIDPVSSFDAIDAAIAYLADKDKFPMLQHIVLAGHSAGGQSRQTRLIV